MAVLPTGIGDSGGPPGAQVSRSLRFNSADSAYLSRTPGSAGNRQKFTISLWLKRTAFLSTLLDFGFLTAGNDPNNTYIVLSGTGAFGATYNGKILIGNNASAVGGWPSIELRDPSAWYHFVIAVDTTQATANNRQKLYINGVDRGAPNATFALNTTTYVNNNVGHTIGGYNTPAAAGYYANGYLAEYYLIDGQQLDASSFGQNNSNTGVWEPKTYSGTYGTNGFYLNFSDNSGTTSTTLGKDNSGNGNNWTPNNFSVTAGVNNDSLVDTPTSYGTDTGTGNEVRGNYATWNPLDQSGATINNGNLFVDISSGQVRSTFGMTTGKWYWECTIGGGDTQFGFLTNMIGVTVLDVPITSAAWTTQYGFCYYAGNGMKYNAGSAYSYGSAFTQNDIIGVALDADTGKIWFAKNGTWQASGNPAAGTNAAFTATSFVGRPFAALFNTGGVQSTINTNFGQRAFSYTAPSGFKALVTQNLSTPTIGATSTTQANDYFDVSLYTGNGTSQSIVNSGGFQPDFVWIKARNQSGYGHELFDAVRGATKILYSNAASAESTEATSLTAFNSNGFSVGSFGFINGSSDLEVAWQWNAGGSNATNTSGTITSTVRANTTSGFSIVTYTGTGANATVGHGLGVAPKMVIVKTRNDAQYWIVGHSSMTSWSYFMYLDLTNGQASNATIWNSTAPTSSVFSLGTNVYVNTNANTYVAYCFAAVAGYSAVSSYTGNGSTDGPFVFCGFRPAYVLIKRTDTSSNWTILDYKREGYNVDNDPLYANTSGSEPTTDLLDLLSNGFKLRTSDASVNASSGTYIYVAFAENPFKYALAR